MSSTERESCSAHEHGQPGRIGGGRPRRRSTRRWTRCSTTASARSGSAFPANLERGTGRILRATNLPFDDFDLAGHARARFGLPVGVENDANAAALAEWKLGAGRGLSSLLLLTLGTGVGGGLVLDDRLYRGWAEVGHIVVQARGPALSRELPRPGHLEALVSGTAADRAARELCGAGRRCPRARRARLVRATPKRAARLAEIGAFLGAAIGSLANLFDPSSS